MFFVVTSNDSFNFPLGLIKYIVIVVIVTTDRHWHMCRQTDVFGCFYDNATNILTHLQTGVFGCFTTMLLTNINTCGCFYHIATDRPWHKCRQTDMFGCFYDNASDRHWHMCRQTGVFIFFTTIVLTGINTCGCFFDNATELLTYMQTDRRVWVFLRQCHWHIDRCADRQVCLGVFTTKLLADLNNCWWFYYGDIDTHSDTCADRQACSSVFIAMPLADIDTYADRDMSDP